MLLGFKNFVYITNSTMNISKLINDSYSHIIICNYKS